VFFFIRVRARWYKSRYLIENDDGIVEVKTDFLGKSICYKFDAGADYNIASFYKCADGIDFKFKIK